MSVNQLNRKACELKFYEGLALQKSEISVSKI
jgi:hypothetical protein